MGEWGCLEGKVTTNFGGMQAKGVKLGEMEQPHRRLSFFLRAEKKGLDRKIEQLRDCFPQGIYVKNEDFSRAHVIRIIYARKMFQTLQQ